MSQTIAPLSALTNLELLDAGGMNLEPASLFAIGHLTNLRALSMPDSPFSDGHLPMMAKLTKLTHLNLKLCPLNFDSTQVLMDLPRLQYLWINRAYS